MLEGAMSTELSSRCWTARDVVKGDSRNCLTHPYVYISIRIYNVLYDTYLTNFIQIPMFNTGCCL